MNNLSNEGRIEIIGLIEDKLNDGYLIGQDVGEIHHEVFNTDYFIIGRYEAEQWLKDNYGIFAAIDKIKEYEEDNFGEVMTELGEAERVVNMLVYILGEELLNEMDVITSNWDRKFNEEMEKEMREEIEQL